MTTVSPPSLVGPTSGPARLLSTLPPPTLSGCEERSNLGLFQEQVTSADTDILQLATKLDKNTISR